MLDYGPEFGSMALLLKTPHNMNIILGEVNFKLIWMFHHYWLDFMVSEGVRDSSKRVMETSVSSSNKYCKRLGYLPYKVHYYKV